MVDSFSTNEHALVQAVSILDELFLTKGYCVVSFNKWACMCILQFCLLYLLPVSKWLYLTDLYYIACIRVFITLDSG